MMMSIAANSLKILRVGSYVGLQNNELQQKLLFAKNGKSAIDCKKKVSLYVIPSGS